MSGHPVPVDEATVELEVNGERRTVSVPARRLLLDCLRDELGLIGTHAGCEHGVCGACTVLVDGEPVRSCLMLAVQADGRSVTTVEGLGALERTADILDAFAGQHGLQCGFCTPGFLVTIASADPTTTRTTLRSGTSSRATSAAARAITTSFSRSAKHGGGTSDA